jgi:hypothetical protein
MSFNRFDVCEAYAMYALLYAPESEISQRLHKIGFRLGNTASLGNLSIEAKEIYGRIVKRNNRLIVGFERLHKRHPEVAGMWPGTYNIPGGDVRKYLQKKGILEACEMYAD